MLKRVVRWVLMVPLVLAFAGVVGMLVPRPLWPAAEQADGYRQRILVLSNAIHTDIAIPADAETMGRFPFLANNGMPVSDPQARWIVFGRGGRTFYIETPTWGDLKPGPLFKGLTLDRAVIHADVLGTLVEPSDAILGLEIAPADYERLLAFIETSFSVENGRVLAIPDAGYGLNDRFFAAAGWFTAVAGCNTWTAEALRTAGLRTGWWNPLPQSLAASLRLYN